MRFTPFPKILVVFLNLVCLAAAPIFGQAKPGAEVDMAKCWSYPMGANAGSRIAADDSRVFLGLGGGRVDVLSLDGKKIWRSELGGDISSNILPLESGLFLVTSTVISEDGKRGGSMLRSLSKETGITNWTMRLPGIDAHFLGGFDGAVIVVSNIGIIQSIDAKSGAVRWKREIADGFVAEPMFTVDKVLVATTAKQIFGVTLVSGEIDSMRKVTYPATSIAKTIRGELIVGDERGNVVFMPNGSDRTEWKFKSGGEISKVIGDGEHVLVASYDNFVYLLSGHNGGVRWKKRLSGRVSQIANVMDKYALISAFEEHGAMLADLSNGKVAGQIAFGADETIVSPPVVANGLIFINTNEATYAYSLDGCAAKK